MTMELLGAFAEISWKPNWQPRLAILRSRYTCVCCVTEPRIPPTYAALYARAGAAAVRALTAGVRAGEIEFPPIPNLNRAGDGSRRSMNEARESNARLAIALAESLRDVDPLLVVFDVEMKAAVVEVQPEHLPVSVVMWKPDQTEKFYSKCGPIVGITPSSDEHWAYLERLVANSNGVIVANGLFSNGLEWLEPVYYLKPCSGWGTLVREYPNPYEVISARTGKALESIQVMTLESGRIRRPNLPLIVKEMQRDYYM